MILVDLLILVVLAPYVVGLLIIVALYPFAVIRIALDKWGVK